jgi:hypothetical protein
MFVTGYLLGLVFHSEDGASMSGVDKTKNNSGASPFSQEPAYFFLQIRAKKTINQTKIKLHILKCDVKTSNLLINKRRD